MAPHLPRSRPADRLDVPMSLVHLHVDLTDVADGELLDGVLRVSGRLQEGIEPLETS